MIKLILGLMIAINLAVIAAAAHKAGVFDTQAAPLPRRQPIPDEVGQKPSDPDAPSDLKWLNSIPTIHADKKPLKVRP